MTFSQNNLTSNITENVTIQDYQSQIAELLSETIGSYDLIGIIFLAMFAYILYKARVSFDTGAVFMSIAIFVFGKYNLLPGGDSTLYGLLIGIVGLIAAGIYRYYQ